MTTGIMTPIIMTSAKMTKLRHQADHFLLSCLVLYAECRYDECRYAECCGANFKVGGKIKTRDRIHNT
jgi:hypothetical protein